MNFHYLDPIFSPIILYPLLIIFHKMNRISSFSLNSQHHHPTFINDLDTIFSFIIFVKGKLQLMQHIFRQGLTYTIAKQSVRDYLFFSQFMLFLDFVYFLKSLLPFILRCHIQLAFILLPPHFRLLFFNQTPQTTDVQITECKKNLFFSFVQNCVTFHFCFVYQICLRAFILNK